LIAARQPSHGPEVARDKEQAETAPRENVRAAAVSETKKPAATTKKPAQAASVESTPAATLTVAVDRSAPVTISGCLEFDAATFWLTGPTGVAGLDVPKSRSWKSGFLRKRSAPIEVVEAVRTLRLPTFVGHRVAATGTLVDRELRVRSVQQVADSCS